MIYKSIFLDIYFTTSINWINTCDLDIGHLNNLRDGRKTVDSCKTKKTLNLFSYIATIKTIKTNETYNNAKIQQIYDNIGETNKKRLENSRIIQIKLNAPLHSYL